MSARSMTGFARVRKTVPAGELVMSVKSVNHRGLDLHFHMSSELDPYENVIRTAIKKSVARGHLQIHVAITRTEQSTAATLNRPLLAAWLAAFEAAKQEFKLDGFPD